MMDRRIGWLTGLLLMAVLCASPFTPQPASAVGSADGRYDCTILPDTTVAITDYRGIDTSLAIPSKMGLEDGSTRTVSAIEWYAFDNRAVATVTIPGTVTKIGDGAFMDCIALTRIDIPNSVTAVGRWVFEGCTSLKVATIGNSVTGLGTSSFNGCPALKSVKLGSKVKTIAASGFGGCIALKSLTLPNSVSSISGSAFRTSTAVKITPAARLTKVTAGKRSARVSWKKSVSGTVSGYQVWFTAPGKHAKLVTTKGAATSRTVSKLTKGKRYTFKVRAYRTISGKRYYSGWTASRTAKIK